MTESNNNQKYSKKDFFGEVDKDKELALLVKDFKKKLEEPKSILVCSNCYYVFELGEENLEKLLKHLNLELKDFNKEDFFLQTDKCSQCNPENNNVHLQLKTLK